MQLRPRTRRRLAGVISVLYVGAVCLALSPIFRSAPQERKALTPVSELTSAASVGSIDLSHVQKMPESLPGERSVESASNSAEAISSPTSSEASEAEYSEPASEAEYSEPSSESASSEAGGSPTTSGGGAKEGSGESVIGFEG